MILGSTSTPGNPILRSSYATQGFKPVLDPFYYAVGAVEDLKQLGKDGTLTFTVKDSILEFSAPQNAENLVAGYIVDAPTLSGDPYISLQRKLSQTEWVVKRRDGEAQEPIETPVEVNRIIPGAQDIETALSPAGFAFNLGNDFDLIGRSVAITTYKGYVEPNQVVLDGNDWLNLSKKNHVIIMTPTDLTLCNNKQQGPEIDNDNQTNMMSFTNGFAASNTMYFSFSGVGIRAASTITDCPWFCIERGMQTHSNGTNVPITVSNTSFPVECVYANNYTYHDPTGAGPTTLDFEDDVEVGLIANNTVDKINFQGTLTDSLVMNNQTYSITFSGTPAAQVLNNAMVIAVPGWMDPSNIQVTTYNSIWNGRPFAGCINGLRDTGSANVNLNANGYIITNDIRGIPYDKDAWSIGAFRATPQMPYSASSTAPVAVTCDLATDGVLTITGAPPANDLEIGSKFEESAVIFVVGDKLIDGTYIAWPADHDFTVSHSFTGSALSVEPVGVDIDAVVGNSGEAGEILNLSSIVGFPLNLKTEQLEFQVYAHNGDSSNGVLLSNFVGSNPESYYFLVTGMRSANYGWDENQYVQRGGKSTIHGVEAINDGMRITNLQIESEHGYGVLAHLNGVATHTDSNYIRNCFRSGIHFGEISDFTIANSETVLTTRNIVHRCKDGITFDTRYFVSTEAHFFSHLLGNNIIQECQQYGIQIISNPEQIVPLKFSLINNIIGRSGKEDLFLTPYKSGTINVYTTITSDNTVNETENERRFTTANYNLDFDKLRGTGYRIRLADHVALHPSYGYYVENVGYIRRLGVLEEIQATKRCISEGETSISLIPAAVNMTFRDGAVLFDTPLPNTISAGDILEYDDGGPQFYYLQERGSQSVWHITDIMGVPVKTGDPVLITSVYRVSNSIPDVLSNLATYWTGTDTPVDIICNDDNATIKNFGGNVTIDASVFSAENPLTLAVGNGRYHGAIDYRHNGNKNFGLKIDVTAGHIIVPVTTVFFVLEGFNGVGDNSTQLELVAGSSEVSTQFNLTNGCAPSRGATNVWSSINDIIFRQKNSDLFDFTNGGFAFNSGVINEDPMVNNGVGFNGADYLANCYTVKCPLESGTTTFENCIDGSSGEFPKLTDPDNEITISRHSYTAIGQGIEVDSDVTPLSPSSIMPYVYHDKSMNGDIAESMSIGPQSPNFDSFEVHFSLSGREGNLSGTPNLRAEIASNVLSFDQDQMDPSIGVGDRVLFDSSLEVILYKKITQAIWEVRLETGEPVDDTPISDVTSISHYGNSLSIMWNPVASEYIPYILTKSPAPLNISNCKLKINIWGYMGESTELIDGNTVIPRLESDEKHYINIECSNDILTKTNALNAPKPNYFDLQNAVLNPQSPDPVVAIKSDYCRLNGFTFAQHAGGTGVGVDVTGARRTEIANNVLLTSTGIITEEAGGFEAESFYNSTYQSSLWDAEFTANTTINFSNPNIERPYYWYATCNDTAKHKMIDIGAEADLQADFTIDLIDSGAALFHLFIDAANIDFALSSDFAELRISSTLVASQYYKRSYGSMEMRIVRNGMIDNNGNLVTINNDSYSFYYRLYDGAGNWDHLYTHVMSGPELTDPAIGEIAYQCQDTDDNQINSMILFTESGNNFANQRSEYNIFRNNYVDAVGPGEIGIQGTGNSQLWNNLIFSADVAYTAGIFNMYKDNVVNCHSQHGDASVLPSYFQTDNVFYSSGDNTRLQTNDYNLNKNNVTYTLFDRASGDYTLDGADEYGDGKPLFGNERDARGVIQDVYPSRAPWNYRPLNVSFSVGDSTIDRKTANPTYDIIDGLLYFSFPQEDIGIGMFIDDDVTPFGPNGCVITEVHSKQVVSVRTENGVDLGDKANGTVSRIRVLLDSASDVVNEMDSKTVFRNLVNSDNTINVAFYNDRVDGLFNDAAMDIHGFGCDQLHRIRLFAPSNISEATIRQSHDGKPATGAYIRFRPTFDGQHAISLFNTEFLQIDSMRLSYENPFTTIFDGDLINGDGVTNAVFRNNYIDGALSNGIYILTDTAAANQRMEKIIITNNAIRNCRDNGIIVTSGGDGSGALQFERFKALVAANTLVGNRKGIDLLPEKGKWRFDLINNIVTDSIESDYGYNMHPNENSVVMWNSASDESLRYYKSLSFLSEGPNDNTDIENFSPVFVDKAGGNFLLNAEFDQILINHGYDLELSDVYPFMNDIVYSPRDKDKWDIGAYEDIQIEISDTSLFIELFFDGFGAEGEFDITSDLHLRESLATYLPGVPTEIQFTNIPDLNAYALANQGIENLRVFVEGNIHFKGAFNLGDRNDKKVTILTYPPEQTRGPGGIVYDDNIIDPTDIQGSIEFLALKVYHETGATDFPAPFDYDISNVKFNNCIVGVRTNHVFSGGDNVSAENCLILYRNDTADTNLYFSLTDLSSTKNVFNTIIATPPSGSDINYYANPAADSLGTLAHCLFWQYPGANTITPQGLPSKLINNIVDDPKFVFVPDLPVMYNSEVLFLTSFIPDVTSPAYDNGDVAYVTNDYDIVGSERVFVTGKVDIGPYELRVHELLFDDNNIFKLIQGILTINDDKQIVMNRDGEVFKDLYTQFGTDNITRDEFVRSEKYILKLREIRLFPDNYNDKPDQYVADFECYIDQEKQALFVEKQENTYGSLFNNIFKDGRYSFFFDEKGKRLYVYLKDTADRGCSGKLLERKLKV